MTDDEKDRCEQITRTYADLLGLGSRRFVVQADDASDNWGCVWNSTSYPNSVITLGPLHPSSDDNDWPFVDREETIAHELGHVVAHRIRALMKNTVTPNLPKKLRTVVFDEYHDLEEEMVEVFARALVAARNGATHPGMMLVRDKPRAT